MQFKQFPVLDFGLAHSGSRPFNSWSKLNDKCPDSRENAVGEIQILASTYAYLQGPEAGRGSRG